MLSAMRDAYSLTDAFTRWRPSPRMSYCTPRRGERRRSLALTTPSASTAWLRSHRAPAESCQRVPSDQTSFTNAELLRRSSSDAGTKIGFQRMNEPPPVAFVGVIVG